MKKNYRFITVFLVLLMILPLAFAVFGSETTAKEEVDTLIEESVEHIENHGVTNNLTEYEKLYVGYDGNDGFTAETANGGKLTALFTAYAGSQSVNVSNGIWMNKIGDKNATMGNSHLWKKYEDGGFGVTQLYGSYVDGAFSAESTYTTLDIMGTRLELDYDLLPKGDYDIEFVAEYRDIMATNAVGEAVAGVFAVGGQTPSSSQYGKNCYTPVDFIGNLVGWAIQRDGTAQGNEAYWGQNGTAVFSIIKGKYGLDDHNFFNKGMGGSMEGYTSMYVKSDPFYTRNRVRTFEIARKVKGETTATFSFYRDTEKYIEYTSTKYDFESEIETDRLFYLAERLSVDFYALRIYDAPLTEAEKEQNRFADMMALAQTDLSEYETLNADAQKLVRDYFKKIAFTKNTAELQVMLDERIEVVLLNKYGYKLADGEACITSAPPSFFGEIIIPNTIDGYTVTGIAASAFLNCTEVTSIVLPNSVRYIGSSAFEGCINLTAIVPGDGLLNIQPRAFYNTGYYNDASNWENGVLYIGKYLIQADPTLSGDCSIKEGTTFIADAAFLDCADLKSVIFPNSVTRIGIDAFEGCTGLAGVYISDLAAWCQIAYYSNPLKYAENLYLNGYLVTDLVIPDGVTLVRGFENCKSLKSVTISNSVTIIGSGAFSNCENITTVIIPDGVTQIESSAFRGCTSLLSIIIPDSVKSIRSNAFYGCTGLETVHIGKSVESIESGVFKNCISLKAITIPDNTKVIDINAFMGCTALKSVVVPDSVTKIGYRAFLDCENLQTVTFVGTKEAYRNIIFGDETSDPTYYGAELICLKDKYTYTFFDEDGVTVLGTATAEYGTPIIAPIAPTKPATAKYTYTFKGFDGYTAGMTLTEDVTFTATYSATLNKYTYTFFDEDGTTVLYTVTADYGTRITAPANPTKQGNAQYSYPFAGFENFTDGMTLTKDVAFVAKYDTVINKYTYTFFDEDGTTVLKQETVEYGTAIVAPEMETLKDVAFTYLPYFARYTEGMTITKNISFTLGYVQRANQYTYTFYDEDGTTVLGTATVGYGTTITAPANPTKPATAQYTYTFAGWLGYTEDMLLTEDVTFTASYLTCLRFAIGDVNMDGAINALDSLLIKQHLVEMITLTETQLVHADTCADGMVNALDAMYIEQYIVEMRDELGDYVTVTFVTEDGEKNATVKSGEDLAVIPEAPAGYKWSETENVYTAPDFTAIIADKKYYLWREGSIVIGGNGSDNSGDDQDWGKIN